MAIMYPNLETIKLMKPKPTNGEFFLLQYLYEQLDDNYEIFFQSHINGFLPDIVILKKNYGALIIEVKDWNLSYYKIDNDHNWEVYSPINKQYYKVLSPVAQVLEYKKSLYDFYSIKLAEKKITLGEKEAYNLIGCAVYFHNANIKDIKKNKINFESNYVEIFCQESLHIKNYIYYLLNKSNIFNNTSPNFSNDLYDEFFRILQPIEHIKEQGKSIIYSSEQKRLIKSKFNTKQKIRGITGSGKTKILAKRAVNAYLRTKESVLILTFNITLRNYIHDMINEVREDFPWSNFIISHYHGFIKGYAIKHNIILNKDNWTISNFPKKYSTILVDESQDYTKEWINVIHSLLKENGELVFFGDERQNIYSRELEDKKIYTKIGGAWNTLKSSYRINTIISSILSAYQTIFFKNKYDNENIIPKHTMLDNNELTSYYLLHEIDIDKIIKIYRQFIENNNIHDNEVCFLCATVEELRLLEKGSKQIGYRTITTFETEEEYQKLVKRHGENSSKLKEQLRKYRRTKKFHFQMNSGKLKFSTIQSFKGWEVENIFLIINLNNPNIKDLNNISEDEIIYTGISRAKKNLIILEIGESKYTDFFKQYLSPQNIFDNKIVNNITNNICKDEKNRDSIHDLLLSKIEKAEKDLKTIKIINSNLEQKIIEKNIQIKNYAYALNEALAMNNNKQELLLSNNLNKNKIKILEKELETTKALLNKKNEKIIQQIDELWKIHYPRIIYRKDFLKKIILFDLNTRLSLEKLLTQINNYDRLSAISFRNKEKINDYFHFEIQKKYYLDFKIINDKIHLLNFYHKKEYHKNMYNK